MKSALTPGPSPKNGRGETGGSAGSVFRARASIACSAAVLLVLGGAYWLASSMRASLGRIACYKNLAQVTQAVRTYAQDYDQHLPPTGAWMDATYPYCRIWSEYHCPAALARDPGGYGYALNSDLAREPLSKIALQDRTPLVYDANQTRKNAATPFAQGICRPPRHEDVNMIGYADGHVAPARLR